MDQMKLGDPYRLGCGHTGRIIWVSKDKETFAVRAPIGMGSCCNTKGNPTIFPIPTSHGNTHTVFKPSHLSLLVGRFLRTLEDMKAWNQLKALKGAAQLKHYVSSIIEYTFYFHKQQITEQEVEQLVDLLEKGGK
jgi:hypothetical protein